MWFWRKRKMKVYEEFIRSHLPEELVDKADYNFDYYFQL